MLSKGRKVESEVQIMGGGGSQGWWGLGGSTHTHIKKIGEKKNYKRLCVATSCYVQNGATLCWVKINLSQSERERTKLMASVRFVCVCLHFKGWGGGEGR